MSEVVYLEDLDELEHGLSGGEVSNGLVLDHDVLEPHVRPHVPRQDTHHRTETGNTEITVN